MSDRPSKKWLTEMRICAEYIMGKANADTNPDLVRRTEDTLAYFAEIDALAQERDTLRVTVGALRRERQAIRQMLQPGSHDVDDLYSDDDAEQAKEKGDDNSQVG